MEQTSPPFAPAGGAGAPAGPPRTEGPGKSDWKVVLQFFLVPLSLVGVLVSLFFGLQVMRNRRPDTESTLRSLQSYRGFLARYVGEVKRWQSGYDLSLLMRGDDPKEIRRILPELIGAFRSASLGGDLKLRRYLTLALGHSRDAGAIAPLREGLRDDDPPTRLFSCWGLMEIGDRAVLPDLRTAVGDADPGVRKTAIFALGQLADREALPLLRSALDDTTIDVRWNAALSLSRLGDPAGVRVLLGLLSDSIGPADPASADNRRERALNAIRGLALLKAPEARAPLARAAADASDPRVQEAARLALDAYGAEAAARLP